MGGLPLEGLHRSYDLTSWQVNVAARGVARGGGGGGHLNLFRGPQRHGLSLPHVAEHGLAACLGRVIDGAHNA